MSQHFIINEKLMESDPIKVRREDIQGALTQYYPEYTDFFELMEKKQKSQHLKQLFLLILTLLILSMTKTIRRIIHEVQEKKRQAN